MKRIGVFAVAALVALMAAVVVGQGIRNLRGILGGYEEVPAISTTATGAIRASISRDESEITYELSYSDLEGTVTQAHIHFGQRGVNGGISAWLCSNLASPPTPAGTQPCPLPPATISGTIRAPDVVGPTAQGIAPGELAELVRAIRAGATYVNVHTNKHPGGEVRSQIEPGERHGQH